jgi:hypothetical protein
MTMRLDAGTSFSGKERLRRSKEKSSDEPHPSSRKPMVSGPQSRRVRNSRCHALRLRPGVLTISLRPRRTRSKVATSRISRSRSNAEAPGFLGRSGRPFVGDRDSSSSRPLNNSDNEIPRALATRTRLPKLRFFSPRSMCPMYVRCTPHTSANSSCDHPLSERSSLIRRPRTCNCGSTS